MQKRLGKFVGDPLVELLEMRKRLVLVTVNFDSILEIKAGDAVRPFIEESELAQVPDYLRTYRNDGGPVPLIKLHGDINKPQSIVVNIEETAGGLSAARLEALEGIMHVVKEQSVRPWWFVDIACAISIWRRIGSLPCSLTRWLSTGSPHLQIGM